MGAGYKGYDMGVVHQKGVENIALIAANKKVDELNQATQTTADKAAEVQIVYKDKIVTQFKTITKEVIKYEETPAASIGLDPEFVRLHNDAARIHDALSIAQPASGVDAAAGPTGITTGEAIGVITRNYEAYYQCRRQVAGWAAFYSDLQKQYKDSQ